MDQAWGIAISPIVKISKRYNISFTIGGIEPLVGFEHNAHISSAGEVLANVIEVYDTDDYSDSAFDEWGHPLNFR